MIVLSIYCQAFRSKNILQRIKHCGGSNMLWNCYTAKLGLMTKTIALLQILFNPTPRMLKIEQIYSKNRLKLFFKSLKQANIKLLQWLFESKYPNLYPNGNLLAIFQSQVHVQKSTNLGFTLRLCQVYRSII